MEGNSLPHTERRKDGWERVFGVNITIMGTLLLYQMFSTRKTEGGRREGGKTVQIRIKQSEMVEFLQCDFTLLSLFGSQMEKDSNLQ